MLCRANALGEEIAKALSEDTTKKYTEEGLGLVETLKKRYAHGGEAVFRPARSTIIR